MSQAPTKTMFKELSVTITFSVMCPVTHKQASLKRVVSQAMDAVFKDIYSNPQFAVSDLTVITGGPEDDKPAQ